MNKYDSYSGGGFVVDLGSTISERSATLRQLRHDAWIDKFSRAVFVEFTVYNANAGYYVFVRYDFS